MDIVFGSNYRCMQMKNGNSHEKNTLLYRSSPSLSCRCRFAYLCHQIDKEEFFAEYEKDLNFVHVEATELDETTVGQHYYYFV